MLFDVGISTSTSSNLSGVWGCPFKSSLVFSGVVIWRLLEISSVHADDERRCVVSACRGLQTRHPPQGTDSVLGQTEPTEQSRTVFENLLTAEPCSGSSGEPDDTGLHGEGVLQT